MSAILPRDFSSAPSMDSVQKTQEAHKGFIEISTENPGKGLPKLTTVAKQMKESKALHALATIGRVTAGTVGIVALIPLVPVAMSLHFFIAAVLAPAGDVVNNAIKKYTGHEIKQGSIGLADAFLGLYFTSFELIGNWMIGEKKSHPGVQVAENSSVPLEQAITPGSVVITPRTSSTFKSSEHVKEEEARLEEEEEELEHHPLPAAAFFKADNEEKEEAVHHQLAEKEENSSKAKKHP
ncbi:hypothetical protein NEOC84_001496|uniref:hypothetical protein n=1 Tax=Neochlamydia sp. AcF84 TaxID=2315858 RepID=UPI00140BABCE|nr:hypothetical protein [Neochlamydia sp. AcF84]NGY95575.1 hypothetical protein [Neochlamydia sp. AcF84]